MMERHQILELMGDLKLAGMRHAYDEVIADAIKRQYPVQLVVGDLLQAEIADKHARLIKYQMTPASGREQARSGAKLPLAKEIADFEFAGTPINEVLVRDLATGAFLVNQRGCRAGRRDGLGQDASEYRHRAQLHPHRCPRSLPRARPIW